MRSFTNLKGEKVEVSEDHLQTAVKLKRQLQMNSSNHRTNWKQFVSLMEVEGYPEAEVSENYRQMIKNYQTSIGELPNKEEYVNLVAESKLSSIKNAVSDLYYEKRNIQIENQKLNKLKRELTLYGVVAEEIRSLFANELDFGFFDEGIEKIVVKGKNKILVPFSDWHIGLNNAVFNYDVAQERIKIYIEEIIRYCETFNVDEIYLAGLGDICENVYLRPTQANDTEFNFSEQIVKASQLIINMIATLERYVHVNYLGIVMGNHDRMFLKDQTLVNDSAMRIVDFCVTQFIESANLLNVTIHKDGFDNSSIIVNLNGFNIKMIHGNKESKSDLSKVKKHISVDGVLYDMLIFGHLHHFAVTEENDGRFCVNVGCLQGNTDYSKELGYSTKASQAIVLATNHELLPIRIGLE